MTALRFSSCLGVLILEPLCLPHPCLPPIHQLWQQQQQHHQYHLEQASEHIVLDRRTLTLLFSLETEYLAIGEQGGRTTRVDKHNMIVATAATCAHQRD